MFIGVKQALPGPEFIPFGLDVMRLVTFGEFRFHGQSILWQCPRVADIGYMPIKNKRGF
jgi:hypothetical protein